MKKLSLFLVALTISSTSFCDIIVTEKNKGLFGYRYVSETVAEGTHTLSCNDPGFSSCKSELGSYNVDGELVLSHEEFSVIDETVNESIHEGNSKGKFVYDDKCLVVYSYSESNDQLTYRIYSISEAQENNLL